MRESGTVHTMHTASTVRRHVCLLTTLEKKILNQTTRSALEEAFPIIENHSETWLWVMNITRMHVDFDNASVVAAKLGVTCAVV